MWKLGRFVSGRLNSVARVVERLPEGKVRSALMVALWSVMQPLNGWWVFAMPEDAFRADWEEMNGGSV